MELDSIQASWWPKLISMNPVTMTDLEVRDLQQALRLFLEDKKKDVEKSTGKNSREKLLNEANKVVNGQRDQEYGSPAVSFNRISEYWSLYLGMPIPPETVCDLMILMKIARGENKPKWDNEVDIAGYAACKAEVSAYSSD